MQKRGLGSEGPGHSSLPSGQQSPLLDSGVMDTLSGAVSTSCTQKKVTATPGTQQCSQHAQSARHLEVKPFFSMMALDLASQIF